MSFFKMSIACRVNEIPCGLSKLLLLVSYWLLSGIANYEQWTRRIPFEWIRILFRMVASIKFVLSDFDAWIQDEFHVQVLRYTHLSKLSLDKWHLNDTLSTLNDYLSTSTPIAYLCYLNRALTELIDMNTHTMSWILWTNTVDLINR